MLGGCSSPPAGSLRGRRLPRRLIQLYAGLALYGVSMALIIRSALGNMPWDVLHQGLAGRIGWSIGAVSILVGALVLLAWIPLRQRPGLGTVSNVVVIGLAVDATLRRRPRAVAPARCGSGCSWPASCSTPSPPRPTSACTSGRGRGTG